MTVAEGAHRLFPRSWSRAAGIVAVFAVVLLWTAHRLFIALSAGDFLYPLEPSEAKHTQIAWDLLSGRFLDDLPLKAYLTNSGNVHHGSYSTVAALYVLAHKLWGHDQLSMRAVPIAFGALALALWADVVRRLFGVAAVVLVGVGAFFVPMVFLGLQVTMLGSHSEAVLPLVLTVCAFVAVAGTPTPTLTRVGLLGLSWGYATAFSYLLWPVLLLESLILLLPPRPAFSKRHLGALLFGGIVGLWPIWLIVTLDPPALFAHSVTEDPTSTLSNLAQGGQSSSELLWRTIRTNLPGSFRDYWVEVARAPAWMGGAAFETRAYRLAFLGPLVILPWAVATTDHATKRLALLVALAPVTLYLFVCWASPWKPQIRERYLMAVALLAWTAPAVLFGVASSQLRAGRRSFGVLGIVLATAAALWPLPARVEEARLAVRPERMVLLRHHWSVLYYNLGIGTVWAEQSRDVNDLLAVRLAQYEAGDDHAWDGVQAGLGGGAPVEHLGLAAQSWDPPVVGFNELRPGVREWSERQGYRPPGQGDDPKRAAQNVGWGFGIRTAFDPARMLAVWRDGHRSDRWPPTLSWEHVFEGWATGCVRHHAADEGARCAFVGDALDEIGAANAEGLRRGEALGRALPEPPPLRRDVIVPTVRGPAT